MEWILSPKEQRRPLLSLLPVSSSMNATTQTSQEAVCRWFFLFLPNSWCKVPEERNGGKDYCVLSPGIIGWWVVMAPIYDNRNWGKENCRVICLVPQLCIHIQVSLLNAWVILVDFFFLCLVLLWNMCLINIIISMLRLQVVLKKLWSM